MPVESAGAAAFDPFCSDMAMADTLICRTRHFNLLYDIRPVLPGHVLIVPIRHVAGFAELMPGEFEDLRKLLKRITAVMSREYASEGSYDVIAQVGEYSGGSIRHLHLHFVPRGRDDKYRMRDEALYENIECRTRCLGISFVRAEVKRLRKLFRCAP